ncbi:MAG: glycosyltransferase family 4 protein [Chryseolinea sp.]
MRVVHLSYVMVKEYSDPEIWLRRINFFVLLLEKMSIDHEIISMHCINYSGTLRKGNVAYHFLKRSGGAFSLASEVNNYAIGLRPDIIIVHGFHFPLQVLSLMQKRQRTMSIIIQHHAEQPLRHYKALLQRFVDPCISAYLFTSKDQARPWVEQGLIASQDKVFEIMEVPSVFLPIDRQKARLRTGVTERLVYLWVGRFDDNKDPFTLIKGFISFAISNPDVILYVVFRGGNLLNDVQQFLAQSDLNQKIRIVGEVSHEDLLYWYNSVDFIISTSHYEGSGVAVTEGMSCGCIPILTNIHSFCKMTNNMSFGKFFDPGNVDQLSEALEKTTSLDVVSERKKVLSYYQSTLSAKAISTGILSVCDRVINISPEK